MAGTTDTVKAILTPGEFVIRKEAVDMIGVPTLEKLNDMPEAGGHSEIDRLIAQATLKNMTGMYGGGMVNKYEDGGQAISNLKPVPDNNPGLAKLPEGVRNKMGYMQEGGLMEMMHGGKAKKKKEIMGYQEGGAVQEDAMMQQYLQSMEAQQPNSFVPFDQRPPSSGEVMSPIPRGMEQGDYYMSLKNELEMENEELLRDKAQNTFDRIRLDSLLNQGAERIERRPDDSLSFQNTPEQNYFMERYREQMIDPMFLPQDN